MVFDNEKQRAYKMIPVSERANMNKILMIVLVLTLVALVEADQYWVSPTGAATWTNAKSTTALSGAACCKLDTANAKASAGDTVWLRGGTYTLATYGINPTKSGTSSAKILFSAYTGESPIIQGDGNGTTQYGLYLVGDKNIHVNGIAFVDIFRAGTLINAADSNIISYCAFYHTVEGQYATEYIGLYIGSNSGTQAPSCHNLIYRDTFHTMGLAACGEGWDLIRIGSSTKPDSASNYNSIEECHFYQSGHTLTDDFCSYNVWRGNVGHNEGWKTDPGGCAYTPDSAGKYPGNGMYGHRCFALSNTCGLPTKRILFERNRIAYASANPANNGADGLSLASPGNIIRFNSFYGCDGVGIYFKAYTGTNNNGSNNRVYNNTFYKNGQFSGNAPTGNPVLLYGIEVTNSSVGNAFKNNLLNANVGGDFLCQGGGCDLTLQTYSSNGCDDTNATTGCIGMTCKFINDSLPAIYSSTIPDLSLAKGSPGIDGGTYLTLANGAGANKDTLTVDDASYFQDGTFGSYLSNIKPDTIAIGTVTNKVQIMAVLYATNQIVLAVKKTWDDDAPIWLYSDSYGNRVLCGLAPDLGAFESNHVNASKIKRGGGSFGLSSFPVDIGTHGPKQR